MARERRYDITLHLENLEQFFRVPEPDPFDPQVRFSSGLDTIIGELKPAALIKKVRAQIHIHESIMRMEIIFKEEP